MLLSRDRCTQVALKLVQLSRATIDFPDGFEIIEEIKYILKIFNIMLGFNPNQSIMIANEIIDYISIVFVIFNLIIVI